MPEIRLPVVRCEFRGCRDRRRWQLSPSQQVSRRTVGCENMCEQGVIFGLGNPLLDVTAHVGHELLAKYGLSPDGVILAEERHARLVPELLAGTHRLTAGGATQNVLRVAQWARGTAAQSGGAVFMGCVGADAYGDMMQREAERDGVQTAYMRHQTVQTGTCGVLVTGHQRSLVAFLGAAQHFHVDHLRSSWSLAESASLVYSSGFHLSVSSESMNLLAKNCSAQAGKPFCMNLSAPWVVAAHGRELRELLPMTSYLFGNDSEARACAELMAYGTDDVADICVRLANEPTVAGVRRCVVITCGADPVVFAESGMTAAEQFPATRVDNVVDTNGAGDAFVGGFLAQLVAGQPLKDCIRCGVHCATRIVQVDGVTLSGGPCNFQ